MNPYMYRFKYLFIHSLCCFFLFAGTTICAQTVKFYMATDRLEVRAGETFILEATLENGQGTDFVMPDMAPFEIVQGPSTSTSISIVNGTRSSKMSYRYVVLAPKIGKFTIGQATIKVDKKTLKSNSVAMQVSKGSQAKGVAEIDGTQESIIAIETSEVTGYIGQQILISYVLYTRQNVNGYQLLNEPAYDGFFTVPFNSYRQDPEKTTINGKEYYKQVVKRVGLFPQKMGNYSIGPVSYTLDIPVESGRSSFFFRDVKQIQGRTNLIKLQIKSLPNPAPISFSGGVGRFEMNATISKNTITHGEAFTIRMMVTGDGDAKKVQPPTQQNWPGMEVYEPSIVRDEEIPKLDKIGVVKEFEYIVVPTIDSLYSIAPEFTYFSTESNAYETIKAGPFGVRVVNSKSAESQKDTVGNTNLQSTISEDIILTTENQPFFGSKLYWGLILIIFLVTGLGVWWRYHRASQTVLAMQVRNSHENIALKNLSKASDYLASDNKPAFFEEISHATTGYILKKYHIPNVDASIDDIVLHLSSHHVSESIIDDYISLQKRCETAKFAGQYSKMPEVYDQASHLINSLVSIG